MADETPSATQSAKRRTRKAAVPRPRSEAALQPLEGEALASWIAALAEERDTEVKQLMREFHLHKLGALSMGQTRLPEPVARRMRRLTGVDEPALHAMTLARYAGNALPHLPLAPETDSSSARQWYGAAWISNHHVRWCSRCIRENNGRWPLRWLLPWTFACVEHRVYLASECQRCQSLIYFGSDSTLPKRCGAWTEDERLKRYGYDERCDFPSGDISPCR